jgi:hypothetical protein
MLAASGITPEFAALRGYQTLTNRKQVRRYNIARDGCNVPGLLIPQLRIDGSTWGFQYRPDTPRKSNGKKPPKYETPVGQHMHLDIPPGIGPMLADPAIALFITEGNKKADCAALRGLCIVALTGVNNFRGKNDFGGKVAIPDWQDIALNGRRVIIGYDGDIADKHQVLSAAKELGNYLAHRFSARPEYLWLPDTDPKTGLDDYLVDGHTVDDLWHLVKPIAPPPRDAEPEPAPPPPPPPPPPAVPLNDALAIFKKWLHLDDDAPIIVTAAAVIANLAAGDPVWLLLVGPPSSGKTEIVSSLVPLPYIVPAATITEAALLSGTAKRERAADATGGLLRQIGDFGILLCKDFTSVLSQNHDTAKRAMAAMREVHDGVWDRPVGVDGARVLHWAGKCGFVAGVTPSYDRYSSVVNALGDRYLLLRMREIDPDKQARAALGQNGREKQMHAELSAAMTGLITDADPAAVLTPLDDTALDKLAKLSIYGARARTGVERNGYTKDLEVIPQPEGPARLAKSLRQLYGGLVALGIDSATRWDILTRIAVDCAPAIRIPLIQALLANGAWTRTTEIAEDAGMVTKTAALHLDDLALIGLAERSKESEAINSAHMWCASDWLRTHWPPNLGFGLHNVEFSSEGALSVVVVAQDQDQKVRTKTTTTHMSTLKEGLTCTDNSAVLFVPANETPVVPRCTVCDAELTRPESITLGVCAECQLTTVAVCAVFSGGGTLSAAICGSRKEEIRHDDDCPELARRTKEPQ